MNANTSCNSKNTTRNSHRAGSSGDVKKFLGVIIFPFSDCPHNYSWEQGSTSVSVTVSLSALFPKLVQIYFPSLFLHCLGRSKSQWKPLLTLFWRLLLSVIYANNCWYQWWQVGFHVMGSRKKSLDIYWRNKCSDQKKINLYFAVLLE